MYSFELAVSLCLKVFKLEVPSPKHVSPTELTTLRTCLRRWCSEVQHDVKGETSLGYSVQCTRTAGIRIHLINIESCNDLPFTLINIYFFVSELQDSISRLEAQKNNMYASPSPPPSAGGADDNAQQQAAYRLHAVFVHEGQAASGHYWAYVYNTRMRKWLKFNDITVSEASWVELTQESYGGAKNHASAYCLMYVDARRADLLEDIVPPGDADRQSMQSLPEPELPLALEKYVSVNNTVFLNELETWDQRSTATESCSTSEWQARVVDWLRLSVVTYV